MGELRYMGVAALGSCSVRGWLPNPSLLEFVIFSAIPSKNYLTSLYEQRCGFLMHFSYQSFFFLLMLFV